MYADQVVLYYRPPLPNRRRHSYPQEEDKSPTTEAATILVNEETICSSVGQSNTIVHPASASDSEDEVEADDGKREWTLISSD